MVATAKGELWPSVQLGVNKDSATGTPGRLSLTAGNFGTGPAIVHSVFLRYNDRYLSDYGELLQELNVADSIRRGGFGYSKLSDRVLPPGISFEMFEINDNPALAAEVNNALTSGRLQCEMYYRSVFDDYWVTNSDYTNESIITTEVAEDAIPSDRTKFTQ